MAGDFFRETLSTSDLGLKKFSGFLREPKNAIKVMVFLATEHPRAQTHRKAELRKQISENRKQKNAERKRKQFEPRT